MPVSGNENFHRREHRGLLDEDPFRLDEVTESKKPFCFFLLSFKFFDLGVDDLVEVSTERILTGRVFHVSIVARVLQKRLRIYLASFEP